MKTNFEQSGSWIGMAGLAVTLFLYGYSMFVVRDVWTVVVLPVFWLLLFVLGCRWFLRHPYRTMALPVLAAGVWFLVMLTQVDA